MPFSIDIYDKKYLDGIISLYNSETDFEAHIAPLTPDRFAELVEKKSYFDPAGLFVAVESGQPVGWIHSCLAPGSEGHHDPDAKIPRIRMLIYPRNRLKIGAALVNEATTWLKKSGQGMFLAIHAQVGYPFYRGLWLGGEPMCPASLPHIHMALEVGSYKTTQESIFMTFEMTQPLMRSNTNTAIKFIESEADMAHEPMRESWIGFRPMRTQALLDGENVGSISWVILPHVADRLGAPCMNIWGLGIQEKHRRKGIATALISNAISSSYEQGARFASVTTQIWNSPAHATYARIGFKPHCIVMGRRLNLK